MNANTNVHALAFGKGLTAWCMFPGLMPAHMRPVTDEFIMQSHEECEMLFEKTSSEALKGTMTSLFCRYGLLITEFRRI
jgi:hypothetical protein